MDISTVSVENLSGVLLGRYELRELIGVSAMSAVYVGYQHDLERHVAIKVLSASLAQDPDFARRFTLEARTIAALEHPHIVPIYDYGISDSISFVVMRLLSGGTLAQRLDQRLTDGGALPSLHEISHLLRQLAGALDYAHKRGVIHRDVKSGNVMFDTHGVAYLVDFGIARLTYVSTSLTAKGMIIGTPSYMAPEQWRDEIITPATDQYALAVMTYAMLTGVLPFDASSPHATMYKHLNEVATPLHMLRANSSEAVTSVVEKAMAKTPEERYPTMSAYAEAFAEASRGIEGQSTGFFIFSLLPETGRVRPVSSDRPLETPPLPQLSSTQESNWQKPAKPNRQDSYAKPLLIGAGVGIFLLGIVILLALVASASILSRLNDERSNPENSLNSTLTSAIEVIPTLTPRPVTTLEPIVPTPALTSMANIPIFPQPESLISTANASQVIELALLQQDITPVRSIAFTPDGTILATGNGDNSIRLWNVNSRTQQGILQGHTDVIYDLAFSPDGSLMTSASGDGTIRLWDGHTGALLNTLTGHEGAVRSMTFRPDGTLLASAGEDGTVRLWNMATGVQQNLFQGHTGRVLSVSFSPDGTTLASGGQDSVILLWDVASGVQRDQLVGHSAEIRALTFSPNGALLASVSADTTVRLWDVETGVEQSVLRDHTGDVFSVAFSPDGELLASGGRDNRVFLWEVSTHTQKAILEGHQGWVFDVQFEPDETGLVSASGDGTVRLWGLSP
jgi:eukaryotic-like serine/threonine-protein kinase